MNMRSIVLAFGILVHASSLAGAQTLAGSAPGFVPSKEADIGAWDVAIVRRAAAMIASPAQWNRSDKGSCVPDAKTVSLRCALQRAVDDAAGRAASRPSSTPRVDCRLTNANGRAEGNCGQFFDESTVFSVARAKAITTGTWRADASPSEVWAGRMVNAGGPVLQQARRLVDAIAPGKYKNARLVEFNNDSTVTFANLQSFFRTLEDRVRFLARVQMRVRVDHATTAGGSMRGKSGSAGSMPATSAVRP